MTLPCGSDCAGVHDDIVALTDLLAAPAVHALRGNELVEWDNVFDVGMTGLLGFSSGYHARASCKTLLMLGKDFLYRHGTPTIWAARYLGMNGKRRLIGSFNQGSMANTLPHAISAQAAFPTRQVISPSGDGSFTMLMGDFISLPQLGLPVKVIVYDNGSLG